MWNWFKLPKHHISQVEWNDRVLEVVTVSITVENHIAYGY